MDRVSYFKSIMDADLQKFIVEHLDEDDETLLRMCIDYLKGGDNHASGRL